MQVVENRSDIKGRVLGVRPHPARPDHVIVDVELTDVEDVPGYRNLFGWAKGKVTSVEFPGEKAAALQLAPGKVITSRIRRNGPDSTSADLTVAPIAADPTTRPS